MVPIRSVATDPDGRRRVIDPARDDPIPAARDRQGPHSALDSRIDAPIKRRDGRIGCLAVERSPNRFSNLYGGPPHFTVYVAMSWDLLDSCGLHTTRTSSPFLNQVQTPLGG